MACDVLTVATVNQVQHVYIYSREEINMVPHLSGEGVCGSLRNLYNQLKS